MAGKIGGDTVQKVGISTKLAATVARAPDIQEKVIINQDYIELMEVDEFKIQETNLEEEDVKDIVDSEALEVAVGDWFDGATTNIQTTDSLVQNEEATDSESADTKDQNVEDGKQEGAVNAPQAEEVIAATTDAVEAGATEIQDQGQQQQGGQQVVQEEAQTLLSPCDAVDTGTIIRIEDLVGTAGEVYYYSNGYYAERVFHFGQTPDFADVFTGSGQYVGMCDYWIPGG